MIENPFGHKNPNQFNVTEKEILKNLNDFVEHYSEKNISWMIDPIPAQSNQRNGFLYPLQRKALLEIIGSYHYLASRWVMLKALTQAGKSATFMGLYHFLKSYGGQEMLANGLQGINKVYILTALDAVGLESQLEKTKDGMMPKGESYPIKIHKLSEIKKLRKTEFNNALVIWDESHIGQAKKQSIPKTIRRALGLNILETNNEQADHKRDLEILRAKNNFFVSISATGFAEELSTLISETLSKLKIIVKLEVDKNYLSAQEMMENGLVYHGKDLSNLIHVNEFAEIVMRNKPKGYILIRIPKGGDDRRKKQAKKQQSVIENIKTAFAKFGVNEDDILNSTVAANAGEAKFNVAKFIDEKLAETTDRVKIIVLVGANRAGKEINTDRVIAIHDYSPGKDASVTVQGSFGRITGYKKNRSIMSFVNYGHVEQYLTHHKSITNADKVKTMPASRYNSNSIGVKESRRDYYCQIEQAIEININDDIIDTIINKKTNYAKKYKAFFGEKFGEPNSLISNFLAVNPEYFDLFEAIHPRLFAPKADQSVDSNRENQAERFWNKSFKEEFRNYTHSDFKGKNFIALVFPSAEELMINKKVTLVVGPFIPEAKLSAEISAKVFKESMFHTEE